MILRSSDNGLTWAEVYSGGINHTVFRLVIDQTGYIYAAVTNAGLLKSTNDGNSWQLLPDIDGSITAVTVNAGNVLYATDASGNYIKESTDQGASWTPIGVNSGALSLAVNDSNQLCAGSWYGVLCYRNGTWELLNNGLPPDFPINVQALDFGPNATGYCIVRDTAIYRTTNNGETWSRFDQGFFSDTKRRSLLTAGNHLLVGMELLGVAGSVSGSPLTRKNEGLVATIVKSVAAKGNRVVALTADRLSWVDATSSLSPGILWEGECMPEEFNNLDLMDEDKGFAWTPFAPRKVKFDLGLPRLDLEIKSVPIISREWNTGLINTQFKVDMNGQIFICTDTLETWELTMGAPPGANLLAHNSLTGDQYVAFFGGVFRYNAQTNSWSPYATTLQPVTAISVNRVTGAVIVELPSGDVQQWTPASGWTPMMAGIPSGFYATGKLVTHDDGRSFEVFTNTSGNEEIFRMWNGTMWVDPSRPENLPISWLYAAAQALYAGTEGGGVWKMNILTDIDDTEMPKEFVLHQNYPNPFNPTTTIRFQVPTTGLVELTLFDLLGQAVTTLISEEKEPGEYNISWDASGMASGVYLYRLSSGAFVQTRKLLLLR
jgi:photosystem II stability/assembly factor-like uncharacterized protein